MSECVCTPFYRGRRCELPRDPCADHPCPKTAVCQVDVDDQLLGYRCEGFDGPQGMTKVGLEKTPFYQLQFL